MFHLVEGLRYTEMIDSILDTDENGKAKCKICNYICPPGKTHYGNRNVQRHIETKHLKIVIRCKFCKSIATSYSGMQTHLIRKHKDKYKVLKTILDEHMKCADVDYNNQEIAEKSKQTQTKKQMSDLQQVRVYEQVIFVCIKCQNIIF